eukprot:5646070-Pyramimonas_sp.AAC.1
MTVQLSPLALISCSRARGGPWGVPDENYPDQVPRRSNQRCLFTHRTGQAQPRRVPQSAPQTHQQGAVGECTKTYWSPSLDADIAHALCPESK